MFLVLFSIRIAAANKAINFVAGLSREDFDNSEQLRLAVTHLLQIIGEAARRVSLEFRDIQKYPGKRSLG